VLPGAWLSWALSWLPDLWTPEPSFELDWLGSTCRGVIHQTRRAPPAPSSPPPARCAHCPARAAARWLARSGLKHAARSRTTPALRPTTPPPPRCSPLAAAAQCASPCLQNARSSLGANAQTWADHLLFGGFGGFEARGFGGWLAHSFIPNGAPNFASAECQARSGLDVHQFGWVALRPPFAGWRGFRLRSKFVGFAGQLTLVAVGGCRRWCAWGWHGRCWLNWIAVHGSRRWAGL
jgi:hypothetical protein